MIKKNQGEKKKQRFIFAGLALFLFTFTVFAEAGILFTRFTSENKTKNFGIVNDSWQLHEGGFSCQLNGGHRFWYKKSGNNVTIHFDEKQPNEKFLRFSAKLGAGVTNFSDQGSKQRFIVLKDFQLVAKTEANDLNNAILVKKGSVLSR